MVPKEFAEIEACDLRRAAYGPRFRRIANSGVNMGLASESPCLRTRQGLLCSGVRTGLQLVRWLDLEAFERVLCS